MKLLPDPVSFEWDKHNYSKISDKHGSLHKQAEEIFVSEDFRVIPDIKHSQKESRFIGLGRSREQRYLFVVFTIRKRTIRIISARFMHKKEVEKYEKIKKNSTL